MAEATEAATPATGGPIGMIKKWFKMDERNTTFLTEFRAGTATFLTLCYIVTVNSRYIRDMYTKIGKPPHSRPCPSSHLVFKSFVGDLFSPVYFSETRKSVKSSA